jgi:hypothetical protein
MAGELTAMHDRVCTLIVGAELLRAPNVGAGGCTAATSRSGPAGRCALADVTAALPRPRHRGILLARRSKFLSPERRLEGIAEAFERQLFLPVFAKNGSSTRRVRRDLHLGHAGARPVCSDIRCTTANRLRHFSHR